MSDINLLALAVALFAVTIWHELGHLTAARLLGVPIVNLNIGLGPVLYRRRLRQAPDLVLRGLPLGMSIAVPARRASDGRSLRPYSIDLWIAAAGSIASFVLTLLLFAVARWMPMPYDWAYGLVGVGLLSAAVALLNLLPIPGLDGGHLLLLSAARRGWEMSPAQESRLQRAALQWVVVICLAPVFCFLWLQVIERLF